MIKSLPVPYRASVSTTWCGKAVFQHSLTQSQLVSNISLLDARSARLQGHLLRLDGVGIIQLLSARTGPNVPGSLATQDVCWCGSVVLGFWLSGMLK